MDLFKFIDTIFSNSKEYAKISDAEKKKHFYMVNFRMAIKFPLHADLFNVVGIDPARSVDSWQMFAKKAGKTPGWMYTKTNKKKQSNSKHSEYTPSDDAVLFYQKINKIGPREFNDAKMFDSETLYKELYQIDQTVIKSNEV